MSENQFDADKNNSAILLPLCLESEEIVKRNSIINILHVVLLATTLILTAVLIRIYIRSRIAIHGNLLFLFANIIAVTALNNFGFLMLTGRNLVLFLLYSHPCQLLTPLWLSSLLIGPGYIFSIAYPALHFCVMLERFRATLAADKYENQGKALAILMVAISWIISLAFTAFVVGTAFLDPQMTAHPQSSVFLTSKFNNSALLYANLFTPFLIIFTAICDWRITLMNKRIRAARSTSRHYSLSRNFQLNENSLTMRLILPLDSLYALLYSLFTFLISTIRAYKSAIPMADFIFYYALASTLLYFYSAFTLIVYIRFVKFVSRCQRRPVEPRPQMEHAKIYFRQLEAQWQ